MIGCLQGCILDKYSPYVLLDVHGIGYEIEVSTSFFNAIVLKEEKKIYTHLIIREDAYSFFGFEKQTERNVFRVLIKISGVGPKLALSILSAFDISTLIHCINTQDTLLLTRIPGVGKKTASRLLVELQGRIDHLLIHQKTSPVDLTSSSSPYFSKIVHDAIEALISLGYKQSEASKAVHSVKNREQLSETQLVRKALQAVN